MASSSDPNVLNCHPGERSLSLITLGRRRAGAKTVGDRTTDAESPQMCHFVQFNPYAA